MSVVGRWEGAGQLELVRVCFEDSVLLVVELGSTASGQDLAITVFKACSAESSLTSVLPHECCWHVVFPALQSAYPKLSCDTESVVVPSGKHPSSIQIYIYSCEGVFKIIQALQVGRWIGVILLLFFY